MGSSSFPVSRINSVAAASCLVWCAGLLRLLLCACACRTRMSSAAACWHALLLLDAQVASLPRAAGACSPWLCTWSLVRCGQGTARCCAPQSAASGATRSPAACM